MDGSTRTERLPDGHKLFYRDDDIYVMDGSASEPEQTFEGPMQINREVPLIAEGRECAIPTIDKNGLVTRIRTTPDTIVALAGALDWQVSNGDSLFEVSKVGDLQDARTGQSR
jgi:hypothetical protein